VKPGKPEPMAERAFIGIDLGGTHVRAALVEAGRVLRRATACTHASGGPVAILRQIQQLIAEICGAEEWTLSGDPVCLRLLQEEAEFLGAGFTGLIHLYSPERVIMGGGVSNAFDLLERDIHAVIRRDALPPFKTVPVVRAGLGHDSGLIGAAALAAAGDALHGLHGIG
jgi:predicted NBD/HSP70 family sugar kinase